MQSKKELPQVTLKGFSVSKSPLIKPGFMKLAKDCPEEQLISTSKLEDYTIFEQVGSGAFGEVRRAIHNRSKL